MTASLNRSASRTSSTLRPMASIARKNLFEDIPRFIVAQAGIVFAVSLVTIQIGILRGFSRSTARLVDQSSADLWVASQDIVHLELSSPMPAQRVEEAQKVAGVDRAEALMIRSSIWRDSNGKISPIRIYGFDPNSRMFAGWQVTQGKLSDLNQPYSVIVDANSLKGLGLKQLNDRATIGAFNALPARFVGKTQDTQSIASSAFIYTSLENANAYGLGGSDTGITCKTDSSGRIDCLNQTPKFGDPEPNPPPPRRVNVQDPISFVLIRAKPGEDLDQLRQRLKSALPNTRVFTQAEIADLTRSYWTTRTGVGFVLGLGATVGFIVGMVIVGQILYSSVSDHIREFGTLKAMGASNWVIYSVILEQALWMAVLGYLPSIALCLGLGAWTQASNGIMILITPATGVGIFVLTVVMCVGSALFAVQKVTRVDPAIVFKA
ncbi:FtsX-like permease family protein [Leptolyngbya sp. NIES-2104]|uniref:FtsX-like permease family protein n=1 Tax=Leptolyngbya sp. NIES-2104 TaxID=1552121 RepID=UPI0009EB87A0|nr:FtsX-like permease family protein [Leptolyngbya sp. NIES-2104]